MTHVVRLLKAPLPAALVLLTSCADSVAPYQPDDPRLFVALSAGYSHTCGINADGDLLCWGSNSVGQLGDGTYAGRAQPAPVAGQYRFVSLNAGADHTCAITGDGVAYCWGGNYNGQLGDGTNDTRRTPTAVAASDIVFTSVSAGEGRTCGIATDGRAYCWGLGPLGDGKQDSSAAPVPVSGDIRLTSLSTGDRHTCGVAADHTAYCWGVNEYGELGSVTSERCDGPNQQDEWPCSTVPIAVSGGIQFSQLVTGYGHTCGMDLDSSVYCWGSNFSGQLGDGTRTDRGTPTLVIGPDVAFTTIAAAYGSTCGIASDRAGYCWGGPPLGNGSDSSAVLPTQVAGSVRFDLLSVGSSHKCGLSVEGFIYCWGWNNGGELGDGSDARGWDIPVVVWGW